MINIVNETSALLKTSTQFNKSAKEIINEFTNKKKETHQSPTIQNLHIANQSDLSLQHYTNIMKAEYAYKAIINVIKIKEEMSNELNKVL